jgi:hypothetical protein
MADDRALIVGISDYAGVAPRLPGCIQDAQDWRALLEGKFAFSREQIRELANEAATKKSLISSLQWLLADAQAGDRRVFVFAGHGARTARRSDDTGDIDDGMDEALVTYPSATKDTNEMLLFDDELATLLATSGMAVGATVTLVVDACHSGGLAKDWSDDTPMPRAWLLECDEERVRPLRRFGSSIMLGEVRERPNTMIVAASGQTESAWDARMDDGKRHGVFSFYATAALLDCASLSYVALLGLVTPKIVTRFPQHPCLLGDGTREEQPFLR